MQGALEGVRIDGRILAVGVCDGVRSALEATGAEVLRWDRFGRAGTADPPDVPVDRVALRLPRGRRALEAMVHVGCAHLVPDGRLWLYGANDEGIRSADRTVRDVFADVETVDARKHGRVLQGSGRGDVRPRSAFVSRSTGTLGDRSHTWDSLPGVFADGRLDEGTAHLLRTLSIPAGARVLDVGCGAGVIGLFLGPDVHWEGVDHDAWAVDCAVRNVPWGTVHQGDVWPEGGELFDHVVSNPPFHTGRDTDFRVVHGLIDGAKQRLVPGGMLRFVCPTTTAVRPRLLEHFRQVRVVSDDRRTRVWEAI